jgi:hypothetical protein
VDDETNREEVKFGRLKRMLRWFILLSAAAALDAQAAETLDSDFLAVKFPSIIPVSSSPRRIPRTGLALI